MNTKRKILKAYPAKESCFEESRDVAFAIYDPENDSKSRIVKVDSPEAQFNVNNPNKKEIGFLAIDHCLINQKESKRCDSLLFTESELCFIELKDVGVKSRRKERLKFYEKLENDLSRFASSLDFSKYRVEAIIAFKGQFPSPSARSTSSEKVLHFRKKYKATLLETNQKTFK
jgi:hypothetical protein